MNDATFHLLDLLFIGIPIWTVLLYLVFVLVFYPPHRHTFDRDGNPVIEFPPRLTPGRTESIASGHNRTGKQNGW